VKRDPASLEALLDAVIDDDRPAARQLLRKNPELAARRIDEAPRFETGLTHWFYEGDTPLHFAAAGHRPEIAKMLLEAGADPNAAHNHRRSSPLHYAADGYINSEQWNADGQVKTIRVLLDAGGNHHARDGNGATPLHRAVRTRCAKAVKFLLESGSDPTIRNKSGSTAFHLAVQNTGRGGSGAEIAKAAQREIIEVFLARRVPTNLQDGKGKTVLECARAAWVRALLQGT
jgi:hypothetical protein